MIIGCPKEMKTLETRVALTPDWVKTLSSSGHKVIIQKSAGAACEFSDEAYAENGAEIVNTIEEVYSRAEFVVKVKELMPMEFNLVKENQIIMAWFHLAEDVDNEMTQVLLDAKSIALGMELIVLPDGTRPTIKPMSEIAGSLAILEAVKYSQYGYGGKGILLRKLSGLPSPKVLILGGGNAGLNAAQVAIGLGLSVTIAETSWKRIAELRYMIPQADVVYFERQLVTKLFTQCDVFLNTIYTEPGQSVVITRDMVKGMKKDALIIDIVGGGIVETSHYTSLEDPIYYEEGILHYNVANMPALCPKTSTTALLLSSGPYISEIADKGLKKALIDDPSLRKSIFTLGGKIVHNEVGINQNMPYTQFDIDMLQ
ncbi:MAG: alanine dehydrogenase [Clostridiaceae bacterium]|nr:alanine dehydrogenase [Clostridiaceae bacterium]